MFHEPPLLAHHVGEYTGILRFAALGSLIGVGLMRAFLPAIGAARRLLWVSIGGVGVNAVLNYRLIHGAFGLPRLGFLGSAVATTITIWLTAFALIWLLHGRQRFRHSSPPPARLPMMGELIGIGWPVAITYGVESTLFLATGLTIGVLGATSLAAHQIALNVASVAFMVPLAISRPPTCGSVTGSAQGRPSPRGMPASSHSASVWRS